MHAMLGLLPFPVFNRAPDALLILIKRMVVGRGDQVEAHVHHGIPDFLRTVEARIAVQSQLGAAEDRFLVVVLQIISFRQPADIFQDSGEIICTVSPVRVHPHRPVYQGITGQEQPGCINLRFRFRRGLRRRCRSFRFSRRPGKPVTNAHGKQSAQDQEQQCTLLQFSPSSFNHKRFPTIQDTIENIFMKIVLTFENHCFTIAPYRRKGHVQIHGDASPSSSRYRPVLCIGFFVMI